jgi:diguanylate cyclase (GGDEF)-like protein
MWSNKLSKYANMSAPDRAIRIGIGGLLVYFGLIAQSLSDNTLINIAAGVFGITNVIASIACVCPGYLAFSFSTITRTRKKTAGEKNPQHKADAGNRYVSLKLMLSVVIPVVIVLSAFTYLIVDLSRELHRNYQHDQAKAAAKIGLHLATMNRHGDHMGVHHDREFLDSLSSNITALVFHSSDGTIMPTRFDIIPSDLDPNELLNIPRQSAVSSEPQQPASELVRFTEHSHSRDLIASSFVRANGNITGWDNAAASRVAFICVLALWICGWATYYIVRKFTRTTTHSINLLKHRSTHDQLTGLLNRTGLLEKLQQHIDTRESASFALVLVDLADFRYFNDTLGNQFGDNILKQVASHLKNKFDNGQYLARINGDVFSIACPEKADAQSALELAREIKNTVEHIITVKEIEIDLRSNLGVSVYPEQTQDIDDMLRLAGIALNEAKVSRAGLSLYQADKDSHSIRKLSLLSGLRRAIEHDQLSLVYQPKVDISSGTLSGVEALVRWSHPVYDNISPLEFIGWAERTGLIDDLTHWVLNKADLQAGAWTDQGYRIPIAVNLSPANLQNEHLPQLVESLVSQGHLGGGLLELELTENAVMNDPERALQTMNRLTELGVRIAIDDFGTGLASFSYLHKFPVSNLKIDRAFVSDSEKNPRDEVLLRSMVELGHNLECVVTAEGVEDEATLDLLRKMRCDYAQGYHLCKPTTADGIDNWLKETSTSISMVLPDTLPKAA